MSEVKASQVWQRRDGSRFTIDHCTLGYAHYWLDRGSKPQFRSINIDRLKPPNYRLVRDAYDASRANRQFEMMIFKGVPESYRRPECDS